MINYQNGEPLLPDDDDDDGYENEEAYDALNDETFGTCEQSTLDDWEQQHEQFAEIKESSRLSDKIDVPPPNLRHIGPPLNGPRHIVMPPGYRMIPPHPHLMPPNGPPGYIYPIHCGSVTAPRKIIDMEVMQSDKEQDIPPPSKDSKKTKQYLLEIEALYSLLLKAEDINNPMYVNNMEKYREMKQKQRLRELEQAPTPEQKQEVLRLFKQEANEPITENKLDYILKICSGFFQEEKISSFLNIRKGK
ncbi:hypothetical protein YQE_05949, partial [Dendroctonus ponderosae]